MNEIDDILDAISQLQEDAIAELMKGVSARDRLIVEAIIAETKDMRMRLNRNTNKDLFNISKAIEAVVINEVMRAKVGRFVKSFDGIAEKTNEYYKTVDPNFTVKKEYDLFVSIAKENAINTLLTTAVNQTLIEPIKKIMLQHVTTGATKESMIDTIKEFVEGAGDKSGALDRYYQQVARDTVNQFERANSKIISDDLGYDKYRYSCGTVKDSRAFCLKRECKVFTEEEVKSWADLNWIGKIPSTNEDTIFINLGGYNCMHKLNGISDDLYDELKKNEK